METKSVIIASSVAVYGNLEDISKRLYLSAGDIALVAGCGIIGIVDLMLPGKGEGTAF